MAELYVAFVWHHHQPYYGDAETGVCSLPWVRLHSLAAYVGMARMHYEQPDMRATFNFAPSLLEQIEGYAEGRLTDEWLLLTEKPADALNEQEIEFVLAHFFSAQRETFIEPNPRYAELYARRGPGIRTPAEAARLFSTDDLRDLQVWATLAWFHPLAVEYDKVLRGLIAKGRGFTEEDKAAMLAKQREIMEQIIPLYRALQEEGRIEVCASPYYHPILPLLCNMDAAREAMPTAPLPTIRFAGSADAAEQIRMALDACERWFGRRPAGMWPSEGAVSPRALELMAEAGVQWTASDQDVLARSQLEAGPAELYEPYAAAAGDRSIAMIFRDHALSDLIGFQYSRAPAEEAARDMTRRLERLAEQPQADRPRLVAIILDGENPWEHYPRKGVDFLRHLYAALARHPRIRPTTVTEYLQRHPPARRLTRVFCGSWIFASYSTWVGNEECNRAWELLAQAREALRRRDEEGALDDHARRRAYKELYIAEGSDWFWWYGDDHTSAYDAQFDAAFRTHLKNLYEAIGLDPPPELDAPIQRESAPLHTDPIRFLRVKVTGDESHYFEWRGAGVYDVSKDAGSMQRVAGRAFNVVLFGFDLESLFVRVDLAPDAAETEGAPAWVALEFVRPQKAEYKAELRAAPAGAARPTRLVRSDGQPTAARGAFGRVLEIAIPFSELGGAPGRPIEFYVSYGVGERVVQRSPEGGPIVVTQPDEDFEREEWVV